MAVDHPLVAADDLAFMKNPRAAARAALEQRLGHSFSDPSVLDRALTHISAASTERARTESYQRLEFLGDRVLGLIVADMLYATFPDVPEGELSRRLAELVRAETCAEVADELEIGAAIRLGAGEASSGGRRKRALLADVCEAVIAAVYLDGGFAAARPLVERYWRERMMHPRRPLRDPKTALQEWAQGRGLPIPVYREVERTGPDHHPLFRVEVSIGGHGTAQGEGRPKRVAEQSAAKVLLEREGAWTEGDEHG
ncbi:ribonuclease III [Terrihabitans sp. B22-R8]|uniref:ribonuclease III n=1 Tax=Terrihabitans sp. B22-R8 TaxID=3425128 RepID=UPI00403C0E6F